MPDVTEEIDLDMLEKKVDGTFVRKLPITSAKNVKMQDGQPITTQISNLVNHSNNKNNPHHTTKEHVGLPMVDNVKQLPISGGEMEGILTAQSNTAYSIRQVRNMILSTNDAVLGQMQDGDVWIKYN